MTAFRINRDTIYNKQAAFTITEQKHQPSGWEIGNDRKAADAQAPQGWDAERKLIVLIRVNQIVPLIRYTEEQTQLIQENNLRPSFHEGFLLSKAKLKLA